MVAAITTAEASCGYAEALPASWATKYCGYCGRENKSQVSIRFSDCREFHREYQSNQFNFKFCPHCRTQLFSRAPS